MPGGKPPAEKSRTDRLYGHITLKPPAESRKFWTWECNHCGMEKSWSSTKRVNYHLACKGELIAVRGHPRRDQS